jgi:hypothetical protein
MPQVHGPALDALRFAAGLLARELNAATDNPLVFADGSLVSGGNFHGRPVRWRPTWRPSRSRTWPPSASAAPTGSSTPT